MYILKSDSPQDVINRLLQERRSMSNEYLWMLEKKEFDIDRVKKLANRYVEVWQLETGYRLQARTRPCSFLPLWVEQYMDEIT